jgi:hypothetical protein
MKRPDIGQSEDTQGGSGGSSGRSWPGEVGTSVEGRMLFGPDRADLAPTGGGGGVTKLA